MDRTSSMGLWTYSKQFAEGATVILEDLKRKSTPGMIALGLLVSTPGYYLTCHALELAFKAYIRGAGGTLAELKKIGHDLNACIAAAEQRGILQVVTIPAQLRIAIAMLNPHYSSKELEYITTGFKEYPALEDVVGNTVSFIEQLQAYCFSNRNRHATP